ncbi:MAG: MFS transporter [Candidatus Thiodiazotropha sp. LLP2]
MIQTHTAEFWRATLALCVGSIMVFSNLYITQPLLPMIRDLFAVDSLQATMSLSVATLSLGGCLLLLGPLSDAIGRRVVIHTSLILLCLTTFATAFVTDYTLLLVLRGMQGAFIAGLPAAAMAYMGEEFEPKGLLLAVGLYIGANSLGGVVGRLISGLVAAEWGWSYSFIALAGFDLVCLVTVVWLLPASSRFEAKPLSLGHVMSGLSGHLRNPLILAACFIGGLNFMIFVNQYSYVTFVLAEAPFGLSSSWLGMLFLTYLSGTMAAGFSGKLVHNRSQPVAIGAGIVVFMIGTLLTLNQQLIWIVVGLFINALGFFFAHSLAAGWVAGHAKSARGSATSLYLMFYYAGATLGGFYLEPFWRWLGWSGVVAGSLLILAATLSLAVWLGKYERKHSIETDSGRLDKTLGLPGIAANPLPK